MGLATGTLTAVGNVIYYQAGNVQGANRKNAIVERREDELVAEAHCMEMVSKDVHGGWI